MLNIATQEKNNPQGILIRAIQPNQGIKIMQNNRLKKEEFNLTNGPGKLMESFGIKNKSLNNTLLNYNNLKINLKEVKKPIQIIQGPRIGVSKGSSTLDPLRFFVKGNPYVSHILKTDTNINYGWENS